MSESDRIRIRIRIVHVSLSNHYIISFGIVLVRMAAKYFPFPSDANLLAINKCQRQRIDAHTHSNTHSIRTFIQSRPINVKSFPKTKTLNDIRKEIEFSIDFTPIDGIGYDETTNCRRNMPRARSNCNNIYKMGCSKVSLKSN